MTRVALSCEMNLFSLTHVERDLCWRKSSFQLSRLDQNWMCIYSCAVRIIPIGAWLYLGLSGRGDLLDWIHTMFHVKFPTESFLDSSRKNEHICRKSLKLQRGESVPGSLHVPSVPEPWTSVVREDWVWASCSHHGVRSRHWFWGLIGGQWRLDGCTMAVRAKTLPTTIQMFPVICIRACLLHRFAASNWSIHGIHIRLMQCSDRLRVMLDVASCFPSVHKTEAS